MTIPVPSQAVTGGYGANDVEFLNLIGQVEAPRGFGSVSDFAPAPPDKLVERMTIGEVLRYQDRIRRMGARSSAIGRYQFIRQTLLEVVRENDVSEDIVFDEEVQTYLARILMDGCGFFDPGTDRDALGNCLAGRWASLPVLSGPGAGMSAYAGDGLNRHLVSPGTVRRVLDDRFSW